MLLEVTRITGSPVMQYGQPQFDQWGGGQQYAGLGWGRYCVY